MIDLDAEPVSPTPTGVTHYSVCHAQGSMFLEASTLNQKTLFVPRPEEIGKVAFGFVEVPQQSTDTSIIKNGFSHANVFGPGSQQRS